MTPSRTRIPTRTRTRQDGHLGGLFVSVLVLPVPVLVRAGVPA
ncbi:hypothetical protein [Goekera deserti]|nr:hypothetical protein [Goekera deserti]